MKIEESFTEFSPEEYSVYYYSHLSKENAEILGFLNYAFDLIPEGMLMLEFGGGPTIYQLISAAKKVKEIYFSDYLESNLQVVRKWKNGIEGPFSWDPYIEYVLKLENKSKVSPLDIKRRANLLRNKITKFIYCDAFKKDPLGVKYRDYFDVVSANFTPESISKNKQEWKEAMKNMCTLIKSGGFLVMCALEKAKYWQLGNRKFSAASIDGKDIRDLLSSIGFKKKKIQIKRTPAATLDEIGNAQQGFEGVLYTIAQKS